MADNHNPGSLKNRLENQLRLLVNENRSETFSVRKLIRTANSEGYPRHEVKEVLAVLCDQPQVQQLWSEWSVIEDREELRLRMELLRRFQSLSPDLYDFITFFFRASDPVMYQTAALTLGWHMEHHDGLMEYFLTYVKRREVPHGESVTLTGERSRRRILLAITAWYTNSATGSQKDTFAFPLNLSDENPGENLSDSDLNVTLIALDTLLEAEDDFKGLDNYAIKLLSFISKRGIKSSDRNLARNCARTLSRIKTGDPAWLVNTWSETLRQLFARYRGFGEDQFSIAIQVLNQADEILGSCVNFPPNIQDKIFQRISSSYKPSEAEFSFLRIAWWNQRKTGRAGIFLKEKLRELTGSSFLPFRRTAETLLRIEDRPADEPGDPTAYPDLFSALFACAESELNWLKAPYPVRIFSTFIMIDLALHELEENVQVSRLLTTIETAQDSNQQNRTGYSDALRILILIHVWQDPGRTLQINSNLIHQIPDPELLLTLVPKNRQADILAALADAFEHHLRLQLVRNPSFSPGLYLYKIAAARPHPMLFDLLAGICKDRVYNTSDGRQIPVFETVQQFSADTRLTVGQIINKNEWKLSAGAAGTDFPPDSFIDELATIRNDLIQLHRMDDLFASLRKYADILDPGLIETSTGSRGLTGLIQKTSSANGKSEEHGSGAITGQITDILIRIRENSRLMLPGTLDDLNIVKDSYVRLKELLNRIELIVSPELGHVEQQLFSLCTKDIQLHMDEWVRAQERIFKIYRHLEPGKQTGKSNWEELFTHIIPLPVNSMKKNLLEILYRSLFMKAGNEADPDKAWESRHNFLRSSALSSYKQNLAGTEETVWEALISEGWAQLVEEAMASQFETRVQRLMEDPVFHFVYRNPGVTALFIDARAWFYDRYNLGFTQKLGNLINERTFNVKRDLLTFRSYLLHFTNIWIALIIGAILMLDFGDAWTALAEIGDVGGVVITFLVGVAATGVYLYIDLKKKSRNSPEDSPWGRTASRWLRIGQFLAISLVYTLVITSLLWLLFSSTDEVIHGPGAILHIFGWTGFALLVGIFFGLLSQP